MKNRTLLIFFALAIPLLSFSQSNRWKRTRYELVGGIGSAGFMGDLGGGADATHFVTDYDFTSTRFAVFAGARYKILEPLAVKAGIHYAMVSGADSKAEDIFRQDRNLSFRSPIIEFGGQLEYSLIKEPVTHRYNLRRGRRINWRYIVINTYVFAGVSGFYFNPKGKDDGPGGTGDWVALQPLGTEGQDLMSTRKPYSRVSMAFPFGFGFKYGLTRNISVGIEAGFRYTLTDYIDDVSLTYVDKEWLRANKGDQAVRMMDKSIPTSYEENGILISNPDDPLPNVIYGGGDQRGDAKYNDFYFFNMITVTYKLRTGRNGLPKF